MKDYFGIDIGVDTIKIVQLRGAPPALQLVAMGEASLPIVKSDQPRQEDIMVAHAETIKKLIKELSIRSNSAAVSLPEREIISRTRLFPPMKEEEVKYALEFEAETFVPYPLDQVEIDYQILEKTPEGKLIVFVVAARKTTIDERVRLLKAAGLSAVAVEPSAISVVRSLENSLRGRAILIIDMAADSAGLVMTDDAKIFLTRSLAFGGRAFTRAISISLGMDLNAAEEYKRTYGLNEAQLEGKVRTAILQVFNAFIEEIKKALILFREERGKPIEAIILTGGGAALPGLAEELVKVLGIETQIAKPLAGIKTDGAVTNVEPANNDFRFSVAIGLAEKEL